jgi:hypothetical protein
MSDKQKRIKNPHPTDETPVQLKKRIKATASPTLAAHATSRIKAGSSAPAASLPSEPGTPAKKASSAKKAAAKKAPAKPAAPKAAEKS